MGFPRPWPLLWLGAPLAFGVVPRPALACGVGGGSSGASACSLAEHDEAVRPHWRTGASLGFTSTRLTFDQTKANQERGIVVATVEYRPAPRTSLYAGLGAFTGGFLELSTERFTMFPGPAMTFGGAYLAVEELGFTPFVLVTVQGAFAASATTGQGPTQRRDTYVASDVRVGTLAGYSLTSWARTYALGRLFGGPIFWESAGGWGTDLYHVQLGAGASLLLGKSVDLFVEGVPLGERSVVGGAGFSF